tara:strand:+ start:32888 stop:33874 length:987 start_codon:yes stop_codon:yes gene_type:complete
MKLLSMIYSRLLKLKKIGFLLYFSKLICNILGIPNYAGVISTNLKFVINPLITIRRITHYNLNKKQFQNAKKLDQKIGFYIVKNEKLFNTNKLVSTCNTFLKKLGKQNIENWPSIQNNGKGSKNYFYNLLTEKDLFDYPEFIEFALNKKILSFISSYYGITPQLCSLGLYYSKVSLDEKKGSQNWHLDGTDPKHVKFFVNISNVTKDDGPLTFLPKDVTYRLRLKNGGIKKYAGYENREFLNTAINNHLITLTGKPGEGGIVDTSSCLHYGSVCKKNPRIVFMCHYATHGKYTQVERNSLRDIRIYQHKELVKKYSNNKSSRIVLSQS